MIQPRRSSEDSKEASVYTRVQGLDFPHTRISLGAAVSASARRDCKTSTSASDSKGLEPVWKRVKSGPAYLAE